MKKTAAIAAVFLAVAGSAHAADECRSETEKLLDINELVETIPPNQAVGILLILGQGSDLLARIKQAQPQEYGAILNSVSSGNLRFDPDSGRRLNDTSFEQMPMIYVHGCLEEGARLVDEVRALGEIEGINAAAPDVKLYPVPVIQEAPAPR